MTHAAPSDAELARKSTLRDLQNQIIGRLGQLVYEATRERDDALAMVDRLRGECADLQTALVALREVHARAVAAAVLHPDGRCGCAGEGQCQWCRLMATAEERDVANETVEALRKELAALRDVAMAPAVPIPPATSYTGTTPVRTDRYFQCACDHCEYQRGRMAAWGGRCLQFGDGVRARCRSPTLLRRVLGQRSQDGAPMTLTIGSLFSGVGGLELGLERATGACTSWQVEIEPFARRVLERHWPHARRYEDVRTVGRHNLEPVDILCGGFPCQDLSVAGRGAGLNGARSGLFFEYARIIRDLRPRIVVMENVSAILARGLGRVLGELASCGYDAEWDCIPASAVGAPHQRDRIWIVAYPMRDRGWLESERSKLRSTECGDADAVHVGAPGASTDSDVQRVDVPAGSEREHIRDAARPCVGETSNAARAGWGFSGRAESGGTQGTGSFAKPAGRDWGSPPSTSSNG